MIMLDQKQKTARSNIKYVRGSSDEECGRLEGECGV